MQVMAVQAPLDDLVGGRCRSYEHLFSFLRAKRTGLLQEWGVSWATVSMLLIASAVLAVAPCAAQEASASKDLPLVWVLSTGGTISGKGASSTSLTEYKAGSLLGEELVKAVPEIQQYAKVKVEQVVNVGSPDITIENWIALANRING